MTFRVAPIRKPAAWATRAIALSAVVLSATAAPGRAGGESADKTFARDVTFRLTYANRDLIWHGDPASPAALVYVKPGARPIAADVCVRTRIEDRRSPARRYMDEARIAADGDRRLVYAFTRRREMVVGSIDEKGRFAPNEFYGRNRDLLPTWPADPSVLEYDAERNSLFYEVDLPGPVLSESLDYSPLDLLDAKGRPVEGRFSIDVAPYPAAADAAGPALAKLSIQCGETSMALATARAPRAFRREEIQLGSFDNRAGTYLPESAYRPGGAAPQGASPSATVALAGAFEPSLRTDGERLVLVDAPPVGDPPPVSPAPITIDGNFDDWRNVRGVSDPRGDVAPYLDYVPDVDLLEFKVAHDEDRIYFYARVAGRVGWTHPEGGRSYFYAYIDVDQDPNTGFLPTRDDECYYGVDLGDDCEVQFEFVDNVFRKSFYGFCGLGGDDDVLRQALTLGKSQYGRFDERGVERAHYKSEYIYRNGLAEITEDLKHGSSDTIRVAISPDGSEVEISSTFAGFLKDKGGRPILGVGKTIDVAAGMECDGKAYPGKTRWAADSTPILRGYRLSPVQPPRD